MGTATADAERAQAPVNVRWVASRSCRTRARAGLPSPVARMHFTLSTTRSGRSCC